MEDKHLWQFLLKFCRHTGLDNYYTLCNVRTPIQKQELQYQLSPIDFMHVSSLFLVSNDKAIRKNDKIHGRKLQKLIPNIHEKSIIDNVN